MKQPKPIYIRTHQVAAYFSIHPATVYRWAQKGRIKIHRIGSCSFVKVEDMESLIEGKDAAA